MSPPPATLCSVRNMALSWQQSAVLAAALAVLAVVLSQVAARRARALLPFARETAVIAGLYSLWQFAGSLSEVRGSDDAFRRAADIARWEHDWHLPSELSAQHLVDDHPLIVQACNLYYATMHFGVLFAFLLWLFVRHRADYARWRTSLALLTLLCLLVQLVPVAPPRLLPGFVDTAAQYGQSVYGFGIADQLSAMPSVHVGWAVLVGWAVIEVSPSRWRWLGLAHPVLTVFVVAATANHFWLDGIVATVLLVTVVCAQRAVATVRARVSAANTPGVLSNAPEAVILP